MATTQNEEDAAYFEAVNASVDPFPPSTKSKLEWQGRAAPVKLPKHPRTLFKNMKNILDLGSAKVYRGVRKSDGKEVCIKKIVNREDPLIQEYVDNEAFISLLCSKGPNILQYYQPYRTKKNTWLVMDWVDGNTLKATMCDCSAPSAAIAFVAKKVLETLAWLHSRHRVHRDIKSLNVMIDRTGKIVVMDFGYAVQFTQEYKSSTVSAGTVLFMAPEVAKGEEYNYLCDVWSLGILVYEMVHGQPPRYNMSVELQIQDLVEGPAPILSSDYDGTPMSDFVERCLQKDPSKRASSMDLLSHPFIKTAFGEEEWVSFLHSHHPSWPSIKTAPIARPLSSDQIFG